MTSKQKKGLRGTIDDVLGDLLGEDSTDFPVKNKPPGRGVGRSAAVLLSRSGKRSLLDADFFSKLAEDAEKDDEISDVSEADPKALVETMKDIDDMDADLFGSKRKDRAAPIKPSSAPAQGRTPASGASSRGAADPGAKTSASHPVGPGLDERKPSSAPPVVARGYRKFSFVDDMRDDLGDLLDGLDPEQPKNTASGQAETMSSPSPTAGKKQLPASPGSAPKKRDQLTFDDDDDEDDDDLMDALGFSDTQKDRDHGLALNKQREAPQRARTRLDEILGIGTSPHLLQRPATGEQKDPAQLERPPAQPESPAKRSAEKPSAERPLERSVEKQPWRNSACKDTAALGEEDFTFGLYQPSVGSAPEGHQSRRQSVRFSMEDVSSYSPERRPKTSTPTSTRPGRAASDWLGLKQDEEGQKQGAEEPGGVPENRKPSSSSRGGGKTLGRAASPPQAGKELGVRGSSSGKPGALASEEEEEALCKSKTPGEGRSDERQEQALGFGEETRRREEEALLHSKQNTTVTLRGRQEDRSAPRRQNSTESPVVSGGQQRTTPTPGPRPAARHTPVPQQRPGVDTTVPVQQMAASSTQPPVTLSAESLQQLLLQQQAETQLWGLGSVQRRDTQQPVDKVALQAMITQLQGQVRSLEMEKDQLQMLLDSVQQRHTHDMELMEKTHRARVKLLEESACQREAQAQLETQGLVERLAASTRLAEQERAELQEQHQRRLIQGQLDRDREVERLRDLQRKSILEMKEDYEVQLQRLRKLKDEEIDAVTSATSQTRSLAAVIEQMEQFSRRLDVLACRVESAHENTVQGLELGARHRDEQLRVLQERLSQQQREMAEERSRLKEVIAKMDTQLTEQQRTLQQERWRVTGEQAKAESALRGLEEDRRTVTQHLTMEREELQRAKQAMMEQCAVERRKLAAEWTQFHMQEKLRQERVEREASHTMEREGSIFSMAQEQAEMTLRSGQLKQKEETLQLDRETLDKLREELEREKSQLSSVALRLQTRAQEVESFSKVASERYEEGERALQEARQVEVEHQTRLRTIHAEMERLRKQEHSLQQERMRMTDHLKEVERTRLSLPINPFSLSAAHLPTDVSPACVSSRLETPGGAPGRISSSPELQATLALLRHRAEKDRDFLQDEQFFLETLKKAPYNSAFHTA